MSDESGSKTYNRPMSESELADLLKWGFIAGGGVLVFLISTSLMVHFDTISLHRSDMSAATLQGFSQRVEYALRYQTILVFWLLLSVFAVIYGRVTNKSFIPLDLKSEEKVQIYKQNLTNSLESIVISVFTQLIFVSFAEPASILKWIPHVNIIQFIGRILFLAGYPYYRSFGYSCTMIPNLVLTMYNVYKFTFYLTGY